MIDGAVGAVTDGAGKVAGLSVGVGVARISGEVLATSHGSHSFLHGLCAGRYLHTRVIVTPCGRGAPQTGDMYKCAPCVYACGVAGTKKSKQVSATPRRARVSARAASIMPRRARVIASSASITPSLKLADMANIGPATHGDLKLLGIQRVAQLARLQPSDAFVLWRKLGRLTGGLHDPCVIDVFMSVISQAHGNKPCPWWHFTKQRKAMMAAHAKHQLTNTRSN